MLQVELIVMLAALLGTRKKEPPKVKVVAPPSPGHKKDLNISVALAKGRKGSPVYYKWDGDRFELSRETLKLQVQSTYGVLIVVRPAVELV